MSANHSPGWLICGEIDDLPLFEQELVLGTLKALAAEDLDEVVDALVARLLGPFLDTPEDDQRERRLFQTDGTLQPIAELLLVDLRWLAIVPGWTTEMRSAYAMESLILGGFV